MDLQETWNKLEPEKSAALNKSELMQGLNYKPHDLLHKLHRQLGWKIFFILLFMPAYVAGILYTEALIVKILLAVLLLAHLVGLWFFTREWKYSKEVRIDSGSSREVLKEYMSRVKKAIRLEEVVGLFLYPVSVAAGFFFSYLRNHQIEEAKSDMRLWIIISILMIAFTPLGWWAARKMNAYSFDRHLKKLQQRLDEIEDKLD
jgi:MFS family permease